MNMFDVTLDGSTLRRDDFEYELSDQYRQRAAEYVDDGDELILGIRPENIVFAEGDERNVVEAYLDVIEPVGSDNYLYLEIGDEECWVRVPGDETMEIGDRLPITFDEKYIHLFRQSDGINVLADAAPEAEQPTRA